MGTSDEELYKRIRQGDREALAELYERREPALYRYALQLSGNPAIAEEAAHEAFLQLIQPEARFDVRKGSLQAYLYGAVRNLTRVAQRAQSAAALGDAQVEDGLVQALIEGETTRALAVAVRNLPSGYREAVVLCDLEERSYEDAAKLVGCPVGTIRSRLFRARRLLAAKLRNYRMTPEKVAR
ncbi:MAG TPA: sigma-70 family RNA polymerase sigma factor [Bryobacteraceae bacterium]|nr:sigma-70 family RNA polymerase sigma factor [Bryobacteraceae bacterium]